MGQGTQSPAGFIAIDVAEGPAHPDGLSLRFKCIGPLDEIERVPYESEAGLAGIWSVRATDEPDGSSTSAARRVLVEDSSDGECWLVAGGKHGLVLEHPSGARAREPYLLLAKQAL